MSARPRCEAAAGTGREARLSLARGSGRGDLGGGYSGPLAYRQGNPLLAVFLVVAGWLAFGIGIAVLALFALYYLAPPQADTASISADAIAATPTSRPPGR